MNMKRSFAVLLPALASLAFAVPAAAATSGVSSEAVSENWAGYEATTTNSTGFSAASGSWVVPTVSCTSGETYNADWVGLGGGDENSSALEQEGTQSDCSSSGKATYYAWYELVPSAPVKIKMTVSPGDRIWSRTAVSGDRVTVEVDNKTTGQNFTKTLTMTDATPDTSTAEWVAEAPSACEGGASGECEALPLADFGTVTFSHAYATSDGHTKSVSGWTDQAIALSPESSSADGYGGGYGGGYGVGNAASETTSNSEGAAPGVLSAEGTSFTVTYGAEVSASATSGEGTGGLTSTSTSTSGDGAGDGYGYGYGASDGYGDSGYGDYGYGYGDSGYGSAGYGYGASAYGDAGYGYSGAGSLYGETGGYGGGYSDDSYYGANAYALAGGSYGYSEAYYRGIELSGLAGD
jgi:hypothetical protein